MALFRAIASAFKTALQQRILELADADTSSPRQITVGTKDRIAPVSDARCDQHRPKHGLGKSAGISEPPKYVYV